MTDEELQQLLAGVTAGIEKLATDKSDKPLTKVERQEKSLLLMKQDTLLRIKLAREKNEKHAEFNSVAYYGILDSWVGKNAFLRRLARARFQSSVF